MSTATYSPSIGSKNPPPSGYNANTTTANNNYQPNKQTYNTNQNNNTKPNTTIELDTDEYFESNTESATILILLLLTIIITIGYYLFSTPGLALFITIFLGLIVLFTAVVAKITIRQNPGLAIGAFIFVILSVAAYSYFIYFSYLTNGKIQASTTPQEENQTLQINFSKPVHKQDIEKTLVIIPELPGQYTYNWKKLPFIPLPLWNKLEITTQEPLAPNTTYTVSVVGSQDIFGQTFQQDITDVQEKETQEEETTDPDEENEDQPTSSTPNIIKNITPQNGQEDVPPMTSITIQFSNSVQTNTFSYSLNPDDSDNQPQLTWNEESTNVQITFPNPLKSATKYTLTIQKGLTLSGLSNNQQDNQLLTDYTTNFTTQDNQNLTILRTSPQNEAQSVTTQTDVIITFDQTINPDQNFKSIISITPSTQIDFNVEEDQLIISPQDEWQPDSNYQITILSSLKSQSGNSLQEDFNLTFSTEQIQPTTPSNPNTTSLQITQTTPADQATDVDLETTITISFNQDLQTDQDQNLISISPSTPLTTTFNQKQISIRPNKLLQPNTTYTITISSQITDTQGNSLIEDKTISFQTKASDPTTNPTEEDPDNNSDNDSNNNPDIGNQPPTNNTNPITQAGFTQQPQLEQEIIRILNQKRNQIDQNSLTLNNSLETITQNYSIDLGRHGLLDRQHTNSQGQNLQNRLQLAGFSQPIHAESIYIFTQLTPNTVVTSWIKQDWRLQYLDFDLVGCTVIQKSDGTFIAVLTTIKSQ